MRIPEVRDELRRIAYSLMEDGDAKHASAIFFLEKQLYRRPYVRKAPVQSRLVTAEVRTGVIKMARDNPDMPNRDIGRAFGIDGGRVSEILAGYRN